MLSIVKHEGMNSVSTQYPLPYALVYLGWIQTINLAVFNIFSPLKFIVNQKKKEQYHLYGKKKYEKVNDCTIFTSNIFLKKIVLLW
jgi:hypothetical protein